MLRRKLTPERALEVLKPYLSKPTEVITTVNPYRYAYEWATANLNQYAIATALLKAEEMVRKRQKREAWEWMKVLFPVAITVLIICIGFYIAVMAIQSGALHLGGAGGAGGGGGGGLTI